MLEKQFPYPPTIVLRHRKENIKKCSLRGLEKRKDFLFFTYPKDTLPPLDGYVLLVMQDAPSLNSEDADRGLIILDGTWRYAERMHTQSAAALGRCVLRTLPTSLRTAYPRKQQDCPDSLRGLASIEAIYAAYQLMGRSVAGLLDHYFWSEAFLKSNFL